MEAGIESVSPLQLAVVLNVSLCVSLFLCGAPRYKRAPRRLCSGHFTFCMRTAETPITSHHRERERQAQLEFVLSLFVFERIGNTEKLFFKKNFGSFV